MVSTGVDLHKRENELRILTATGLSATNSTTTLSL